MAETTEASTSEASPPTLGTERVVVCAAARLSRVERRRGVSMVVVVEVGSEGLVGSGWNVEVTSDWYIKERRG